MSIQSSINSMIGTVAGGVRSVALAKSIKDKKLRQAEKDAAAEKKAAGSSPQAKASNRAAQSAANEIEAKKVQRQKVDQLKTSWGGTVAELPDAVRERIYKEYSDGRKEK